MKQENVKDFAEYEVYELVDGKYHCLCLCKEWKVAEVIAKLLAKYDPQGDAYYITGVSVPNTLVPGGGWYECYQRDKDGKLKHTGLGQVIL